MLQFQHCTHVTIFFPIIIPFPASLIWHTSSGRYSTCTGTMEGWKLSWEGNLRAAEMWILSFRTQFLKSLLTLLAQSEDVRLIWQADSQLLSFLPSKAEPKQSFLLSVCRFESCGHTWAHQTCLSIKLSWLDTGTVTIPLVNISLSECLAQLHTTRVVFGNSILTGCVLKLSFHLPRWHHFLCCAKTEAPEVSYWQFSSQKEWKLTRSL